MKANIGTIDKAIRIVAGLVLLSLVFVGPKSLLGLIGIVPLLTGLLSWCPAYTIVGIATKKENA